ncbi:MAG: PAS domain-containing protein, partial [Bacillota bacterium]|nr:PAS domain-containing protein [Bacillota bacterium]
MLSAFPIDMIYRQSLHCLPDAFVLVEILDKEKQIGRIIDLNDKACILLQYEKRDLLSIHSDVHPVTHFFTTMGMKDGEVVRKSKVLLKTKYGDLVHVEIQSNQFMVGQTVFYFHSMKEIAEERENSPKESVWIKTILDTIEAYMVILSPDGRVVEWNSYCEQQSGYTLKEMKGKFFWDILIEKEERAYLQEIFARESNVDISFAHENFWLLKNGKRKFIKWSNSVIKDKEGKLLYVLSTGIDITERKEIEESLLTNENRFRTLVDSMDDLVFTVDKDIQFSGVFGKWFQTNNISKDRLLNKKLYQLNLTQKEIEIHTTAFEQAFAGEKVIYDWTLENPKQPIYFQTFLSPMLTPGQEVKELVGVTRDITELKNKETLLKELNRQNEAILSSTADGILVVNQRGMITFANEKAVEMLSAEGESPIGVAFPDIIKNLIPEESRKGKTEFEDNEIFETECKLENGKRVYYQFLGNEMKEGNLRKGYVISIRDVTYKRDAEEQQNRFYEAVSSGITVINKEGKILFCNGNAGVILGYRPEKLAGLDVFSTDWNAIDENGKPLMASDYPVMITFTLGENVYNFIMAVYNPIKKQHRWLLIDSSAIFQNDDPMQPIEYVIATFSDITEHLEIKQRMVKSEKLAA